MRPIRIDDDRMLRPVASSDLHELHALIVANREHLAPWMPWAVKPQRADTAGFLGAAEKQAARKDGVNFAVIDAGRIIGTAGFHSVNRAHGTTSIGYWLAADAQGCGTITLTVAALLQRAFETWDLHRVEIRVAVGNARSHAVARRLEFVEEGILRGAERVGERWLDLVVYSVLADEWRARRGPSTSHR